MGSAIASNLIKTGHPVTVFNRTAEKARPLVALGARQADSITDAVSGCDVVFTMLADDAATTDVAISEHGIAAALPSDAIHISLSTISVTMARKLAAEHSSRGQRYISAPVFGRPDAAEAKRLIVVAAGDPAAIQVVQQLFDAIGRHTYVVSQEPWHANLMKLNGNFMIACVCETFGEAFATMRKAGLDHQQFHEIMCDLFNSPVYKGYGSVIAGDNFEPAGFALRLGLKDIRLGLEAADELNVAMPFASVLRDHFIAAMANGQADMDWSSVSRIPALMAGLGKK